MARWGSKGHHCHAMHFHIHITHPRRSITSYIRAYALRLRSLAVVWGCSCDGDCYAKCRWEGLPDAKANLSKLGAPGLWTYVFAQMYIRAWQRTHTATWRLRTDALTQESTFANGQAILWALWFWNKLIFSRNLEILLYLSLYWFIPNQISNSARFAGTDLQKRVSGNSKDTTSTNSHKFSEYLMLVWTRI